MIPLKRILLPCLLAGAAWSASSQYISVNENYTTDQLVNDVLIGNPCAQASNIAVTTWNFGSGNTFGYFNANGSDFPFANGIVITTGRAESAIGPNTSILSEGPTGWDGDDDLEQALDVSNTINATVIEFDFLPQASRFSFDYIFSSEQYLSNPSANQCGYTDGFAFLLKKADNSEPYQNLAVLPGTDIPVTVNTVRGFGTICDPAGEQYFDAYNGSNHPTNYNGQTKIMKAEANVEPGVLYHIKIVIADQGNNLYDSAIFLGGGSFKTQISLGPDRTFENIGSGPLCEGDSLLLNATQPGATNYQWFRDGAPLPGETSSTYNVTQAGTYVVEFIQNSCALSGEIEIDYQPLPVINTPLTLVQCGSSQDITTTFNLPLTIPPMTNNDPELNGLHFFETLEDAEADENPILEPFSYTTTLPKQVFARIFGPGDCYSIGVINLELSVANTPPIDVFICEDDGSQNGLTTFNLSQDVTPTVLLSVPAGNTVRYFATYQNAVLEQNQLANTYSNSTPNEVIYARVQSNYNCYDIITINLHVPVFDLSAFDDEDISICNGAPTVLAAPAGYSDYTWSTSETSQQITVTQTGDYSVTAITEGGCEATKVFHVSELEPPVFISSEVVEFQGNNNSITVIYSGNGAYEFSLDGDFFQSSPTFTNVAPGEYQIYIRDASGCYLEGPFSVTVSDFPRFFTPNGDGFNDFWQLKLYDARPATVSIFDRYGKLLHSFDSNGIWDGKAQSRELPSTDYWFLLEFQDGKQIKGHFSLKR